ncbi:hypothetical protein ABZ883_17500 [Streptomyces sp. NPDC046977]|uniref:hypothetical protein n=1 Tax=Streptomyces sp. NPDC046977 TaxID=3154703 RepID=UPI0033C9E93A
MRTQAFTFVLAPALLAVLTACSGSSQPTTAPKSAPPRAAAATHSPTVVGLGTVPNPDFIGANVKGALDQLGPDADVRITDAGGRHRTIEDPSTWKICTSSMEPGPIFRFGAVMTNEHC